jgi:hypothetical protein
VNEFLEMTSCFSVRIGDDVDLVSSPHRDRDVVETETGKGHLEDYLMRIVSVDREFRAWRFRSMIEDCPSVTQCQSSSRKRVERGRRLTFDVTLRFEDFASFIQLEFLSVLGHPSLSPLTGRSD